MSNGATPDPGMLGGIAACIAAAIGAIWRGEHRGRAADTALVDARKAAEDVRKEVAEQLDGKVAAELCGERTKRIEGQIESLAEKSETAFHHQYKSLERIEAVVNRLAEHPPCSRRSPCKGAEDESH